MALLFAKNNSLSAVTALPTAVSGGGLNLISTQTASSSATIDFTSGIDSTYKEYIFKFIDIHPATDKANFQFQVDTGTNTNYNQTVTSTHFTTRHHEDASATSLGYDTGSDLAQSTSFIPLTSGSTANNNDDCMCGEIWLFGISSTTFVKHFMTKFTNVNSTSDPNAKSSYVAGYFNTTSAIDEIQFKFSSGNIDSGTFKLYGIKDS